MKDLTYIGKPNEIGSLIRSYDWAHTPLGAIANWSSDLKVAVEILVTELDRLDIVPVNQNTSQDFSEDASRDLEYENLIPENDCVQDGFRRRYNTLFDSIDQGFCVCEMIFDDRGAPLDYRFLEINNKYELMTGLTDVIGKTARELLPTLEDFWFETYSLVTQTGKSVRFENHVPDLHRWFDVNAFPIESPHDRANNSRFGILFTDISDRKHQELNNKFLDEVQKDLAILSDPTEIMSVVGEKIRCFFGFSILSFVDINTATNEARVVYNNRDADIFDAVSTHRLHDYFSETHLSKLKAGQTITIKDVTTDPEIKDGGAAYKIYQVRSAIHSPHLSDGQWKFMLGGHRRESSNWRADEVELIDELTARLYLRISRTRAELALAESEARFRNMADTAPVLIWMSGTDKLCNYFNQPWLDYAGRTLEQEMGNGWAEGVYADDFQFCLDTYFTAFDARESFQMEYRFRRFDGQYRWFLDTAHPRFTPEGEFLGYIGSCFDIEDRKQQELNNNFLAEIQNDLALIGDINQMMDVVGEKIRNWFGFSVLAFIDIDTTGEQVQTFYSSADPDIPRLFATDAVSAYFSPTHSRRLQSGQAVAINDVNNDPEIKANGVAYQIYQARSLVSVPYLSDGRWKFLLAGSRRHPSNWQQEEIELMGELIPRVYLEIERSRSEAALEQSEERYRNLIELIPQLIWKSDDEGKVIDVNQRFLDYTGIATIEAVKNLGLQSLVHPDDYKFLHDAWKHSQSLGIPLKAEGRIRQHDGVYRWHLHQAIPRKNENGEAIRWIIACTDIEEQKQLEKDYTSLLQKVQERNQELDQFTHIVSHDLKAPLRGISNLSQWLEDDLEDSIPPENKQQLQLMRSRVFRMEGLINGLLSYARIGREVISTDLVSMQDLLAEILDSLDPPPTFRIEIASDLPTFTTKRILLNQVLSNLIGNAIKHHDRPDGKIAVSVQEYTESPEFYEFVVTDDGRGIDPNQQKRIFDIFQTLNRDNSESTGIGLAIVKKIVETEGGKIYLQSEFGKGSSFYFTWRKSAII